VLRAVKAALWCVAGTRSSIFMRALTGVDSREGRDSFCETSLTGNLREA
jgi:hypothetical protein